jgi:DNA-directed RNA polymerase specialized sigma24 family protein
VALHDTSPLGTDSLCERLARGETDALVELWRRHGPKMREITAGYLRGKDALTRLYDEDEFLDQTYCHLAGMAARGELATILKSDRAFWMVFGRVLRREILNEWQRVVAYKRTGALNHPTDDERPEHGSFRQAPTPETSSIDLDLMASRLDGPEASAIHAEIHQLLFECLTAQEHWIVDRKLEGITVREIADRLGVSERTIARRLEEVRRIWAESGLLQ